MDFKRIKKLIGSILLYFGTLYLLIGFSDIIYGASTSVITTSRQIAIKEIIFYSSTGLYLIYLIHMSLKSPDRRLYGWFLLVFLILQFLWFYYLNF